MHNLLTFDFIFVILFLVQDFELDKNEVSL